VTGTKALADKRRGAEGAEGRGGGKAPSVQHPSSREIPSSKRDTKYEPYLPTQIAVAIWREKWNWFSIETMSAKDILLEVAEKLPPEATLNDAIYELEFRQAVQQGLDELDRGEGIPIEQVKAQIAAWAGK
jgi:hypothetical protein